MVTINAINQPTGATGTVVQGQGVGTATAFSTATYPSTATGTGTILRADGTNWVASTSTYPDTNAVSTLLYASSSNVMGALATGNDGVLITSHTGVPSWLANGTTGQILTATTNSPPTWAAAPASGIPTIGASTNNGIVTWNGTLGAAVNSTASTVSSLGVFAAQGTAATAGAPAYSFLGDSDTGIYSDAANTLKHAVGGSNVMTMQTSVITTFQGLTISNGNFTFAGGFIGTLRSVAGAITGSLSDYILNVTSTAAPRTVTVPNNANTGQVFIIKDGSGGAATNNITLTTPGGTKTFDGATSVLINTNWGSLTVTYDGTNYLIL